MDHTGKSLFMELYRSNRLTRLCSFAYWPLLLRFHITKTGEELLVLRSISIDLMKSIPVLRWDAISFVPIKTSPCALRTATPTPMNAKSSYTTAGKTITWRRDMMARVRPQIWMKSIIPSFSNKMMKQAYALLFETDINCGVSYNS